MILNELSLKIAKVSKQDVKELMTSFLRVCHELKKEMRKYSIIQMSC